MSHILYFIADDPADLCFYIVMVFRLDVDAVFLLGFLQRMVSAVSTTNLRPHLSTSHKKILIKEVRCVEAMEPCNATILKSLKNDYELLRSTRMDLKDLSTSNLLRCVARSEELCLVAKLIDIGKVGCFKHLENTTNHLIEKLPWILC